MEGKIGIFSLTMAMVPRPTPCNNAQSSLIIIY